MKLQRTTLILAISALLLGGFVYFSEIQAASKRETVKSTKQPIFSFKEDQIEALTIYTNEETLGFERTDGKQTNWRMKTPKETPASDASVAFLLKLLVEGRSDRSFPIKTKQLQEYGLDQPSAIVRIQLKNQRLHRLILGKPDFNRAFLYAQADPPPFTAQQSQVLLVPIDFEYAVKRPLSEWQIKPEKSESPKPSPTTKSPEPSPTSSSPKPSPTSEDAKPSPTAAESPKPSPTPDKSKPSPTAAESPKPSPTPGKSKPSPTTAESPKPSSTPSKPKPSPTAAESPRPSPTPSKPKPAPTAAESPKPSPTPSKPKPAPTAAESPKPSPSAESPKPSPSAESPKPPPNIRGY